ncbi:RNA polymerase sigma factor [Nonomuraea sp. NPDC049480]|uniref:RNA polymerase sigma factor n=1 Tax=Nonomuraea sp. NPDC049480 TaxID=3364353 RepID=UPI0037B72DAC
MTIPREVVEIDDATLIERSLNEPEIFAILFDRHAPLLHRYVTRRLGPSEAEDVVADTFLAAFQRRGDYDRDRPDARPWLYGIASNVIGKRRRAEKNLYQAYIRSGVHPAERPGLQVEDGVNTLAVNRPLARALLRLNRADRDVLLLDGMHPRRRVVTTPRLLVAAGVQADVTFLAPGTRCAAPRFVGADAAYGGPPVNSAEELREQVNQARSFKAIRGSRDKFQIYPEYIKPGETLVLEFSDERSAQVLWRMGSFLAKAGSPVKPCTPVPFPG